MDSTVTNYARGGGDGVARRISVQMDYGVAYDEHPAHVKQVMLRLLVPVNMSFQNLVQEL